MIKEWKDFVEGNWTTNIDVRDFIQKNYTQYNGDESFLEKTTDTSDDVIYSTETTF